MQSTHRLSQRNTALLAAIILSASCLVQTAAAADTDRKNNLPVNPFLANSPYPVVHVDSGVTAFSRSPGPVEKSSRQLSDEEIIFKPLGFANGFSFLYSGLYPDGRRATWGGGNDRIVKLDAETLEVLSIYALREGPLHSDKSVEVFFDDVDKLVSIAERDSSKIQAVFDRVYKTMIPALRIGAGAVYKLINRDNELFITLKNANTGIMSIIVYGDSEDGDIESPIELKRSFDLPNQNDRPSLPMAMNMTYDGWIVSITNDGRIFIISNDLQRIHSLTLPEAVKADQGSAEWMGGVVRNGVGIDDMGGIYVVSREYLHRVQWTGSQLSLDPKDGAWSVSYPSGVNGSGTTPTPLGWGKGKDLLVTMLDGEGNVNLYWRDKIPDDWQTIEGHPRRLAGTLPLSFGDASPDEYRIEASPVASGYSFFWANDTSNNQPPWQGAFDKQMFANYTGTAFPEHAVFGGVQYKWNEQDRKLELAWTTPLSLAPTLCTPNINGLLYCMGRRDGQYSMEALSWESGSPAFHYLLGKSYRFNATAAVNRIINGRIEFSSVGNDILRISPKLPTPRQAAGY